MGLGAAAKTISSNILQSSTREPLRSHGFSLDNPLAQPLRYGAAVVEQAFGWCQVFNNDFESVAEPGSGTTQPSRIALLYALNGY